MSAHDSSDVPVIVAQGDLNRVRELRALLAQAGIPGELVQGVRRS